MDLIRNILTRFARTSWYLTFGGIVFACCIATASAQQQFPIVATASTLFVMGNGYNTQILDSHNRQIAMIPEYGNEAVGSDGTVYVARLINGGYSTNALDLFAPPYKKRSATLAYGGFGTSGVATDPQHGMFAVTGNWMVSPLGGPGFMRLYKDGTTKPCSDVPFPAGRLGDSSTFDREGTFYTYLTYQNLMLVSVAGGCKAKQFIIHRLPSGTIPSPLAFDNNDHLLLQQYSSNVITIHAHPGYGPVGPPIATTTLATINGNIPHFVCLTSDGKHLWADSAAGIAEYLYPQGGAPLVVIRKNARYSLLDVFPPFKF